MRRKKHIEELEQIKEIKEMADIIHEGDCPIIVLFYNDSLTIAENLYNAGYRKASEVERKIFEDIRELTELSSLYGKVIIDVDKLAELKKKYESEV